MSDIPIDEKTFIIAAVTEELVVAVIYLSTRKAFAARPSIQRCMLLSNTGAMVDNIKQIAIATKAVIR